MKTLKTYKQLFEDDDFKDLMGINFTPKFDKLLNNWGEDRLKIILKNNIDMLDDSGISALEVSISSLNISFTQYLLDNNVNCDIVFKFSNLTPLQKIVKSYTDKLDDECKEKHLTLFKMILKSTKNLNKQTHNGNTLLIDIVNNAESIKLEFLDLILDRKNVDWMIKNNFGNDFIDFLNLNRDFDIIEHLKEKYPKEYEKYDIMKKTKDFNL